MKTDDFMAAARNVDQHGRFNTGTSALSGLLCLSHPTILYDET